MALGVPFGNYRLVRRIARGGMAEVFLAWQLSSSQRTEGDGDGPEADGFYDNATGIRFVRQVAVKRILPHLSESDEFRALFLQEARLAATLSHPNVVHIHDVGRSGDCLFLAMELIEGIDLGALCRMHEAPLPIEHALRICADALAGLHHAHTRTNAAGRLLHIVHRDVSPQNVMITLDGVVKILDFGIAKAAWSAQETRPGVIRGKYAYMSPEQAEGQKLDARSDLYAVGVCLFELLSQTPLFPRDLPLTSALRLVRGGGALPRLEQLENLRPDVPQKLYAILRRALQTRREHRFESAAEMQLELERFLKDWPRLSSTVLLSEVVRRIHGHERLDEYDHDREEQFTPVLVEPVPPGNDTQPHDFGPATLLSEVEPSTVVLGLGRVPDAPPTLLVEGQTLLVRLPFAPPNQPTLVAEPLVVAPTAPPRALHSSRETTRETGLQNVRHVRRQAPWARTQPLGDLAGPGRSPSLLYVFPVFSALVLLLAVLWRSCR